MMEKCVNLSEDAVLIVEAPTGAGKSGAPALTSHFRPGTTVLVRTRDLQQQYADSFQDVGFITVWGVAHYPCVNEEHIAEFQEAYGELPTRADCPFTKAAECPDVFNCEYECAKTTAMISRAKTLNYAYAFYSRWWRPYAHDLFCDEAHRLPTVLSDLISIDIADATRRRYSFPEFPVVRGGSDYAVKNAADWLGKCATILVPHCKVKDIKAARRAKRFKDALNELHRTLYSAGEGDWYVESGAARRKFTAQPVVPGKYANRLFPTEARSRVLMSATIGDPQVLASELGIDEFSFLTLPHIFPRENRPVYLYESAPKLSYKSPQSDYDHQVKLIVKILNQHNGQKGVIHTASWKHANAIADALGHDGLSDRVYVPNGDRVQAVEEFKQAQTDLVAISPSWKEGLDFRDDQARFSIIAKVPFLSLANPVTRLRLKRKGGRAWYDWVAALAVVQAAGRAVRHIEDHAATYILDANWRRVASRAPKWFEWETI